MKAYIRRTYIISSPEDLHKKNSNAYKENSYSVLPQPMLHPISIHYCFGFKNYFF